MKKTAEEYISLTEAAELEGIRYDAMRLRISRKPEKFTIVKKQKESGGKEVILITVSSLSKQARSAYKERVKLQEAAETEALGLEQATPAEQERPWYVTEDIDWFREQHKTEQSGDMSR